MKKSNSQNILLKNSTNEHTYEPILQVNKMSIHNKGFHYHSHIHQRFETNTNVNLNWSILFVCDSHNQTLKFDYFFLG